MHPFYHHHPYYHSPPPPWTYVPHHDSTLPALSFHLFSFVSMRVRISHFFTVSHFTTHPFHHHHLYHHPIYLPLSRHHNFALYPRLPSPPFFVTMLFVSITSSPFLTLQRSSSTITFTTTYPTCHHHVIATLQCPSTSSLSPPCSTSLTLLHCFLLYVQRCSSTWYHHYHRPSPSQRRAPLLYLYLPAL